MMLIFKPVSVDYALEATPGNFALYLRLVPIAADAGTSTTLPLGL